MRKGDTAAKSAERFLVSKAANKARLSEIATLRDALDKSQHEVRRLKQQLANRPELIRKQVEIEIVREIDPVANLDQLAVAFENECKRRGVSGRLLADELLCVASVARKVAQAGRRGR